MAFTPEDGTGVTGANSYATTAEADTYWNDRGDSVWSALASGAKQAALIKATAYIDGRYFSQFRGTYPLKTTQGLQWPRSDAVDARGLVLSGIPQGLKNAVLEAAYLFTTQDLNEAQERGGAVKRVKVGPIEQEFSDGAPMETVYPAIENALRQVLQGGGAGSVRLVRG